MSAEQEARDILELCGVEDAQSFTAGDVVALANLIAELHLHRRFVQDLVAKSQRDICPVCSYLWRECECGVGAAAAQEASQARLISPETAQNAFGGVVGAEGSGTDRRTP